MYPWRLIAMLEQADPSFQDLFYPGKFRCSLDNRIVRAIEERWSVYFPTRKECRGASWSLTIPENEPLYQPHPKSLQKLADWKKSIKGTIAEIRAHKADISWKRFAEICQNIPRLRLLLKDFKPLSDFLIFEESLWPSYDGIPVSEADYFRDQMRALLAPGSPYHHADPRRLKFLNSQKSMIERIRMIGLMRQLYDRPLMVLAVLQICADASEHPHFWLPIQNYIGAIVAAPSPITFRRTWLEHAMQVSGAVKKSGKTSPRKWARMLITKKDPDLNAINAKAIEVHYWLRGKKQPSMETVRRIGRIIFATSKPDTNHDDARKDLWLFSWMVTLWLEKHFTEIAAEFKGDRLKIQKYYRRFFHYLEIPYLIKTQGTGGCCPPAL
jgi:hypothetical protein